MERKLKKLSNKIEKIMNEFNSENCLSAPLPTLHASLTRPLPLRYGRVMPGYKYHVKLPMFPEILDFVSKYLKFYIKISRKNVLNNRRFA